MARRKLLRVSAQLLVDMCKGNPSPRYYEVTENALPDDARAVGGEYGSMWDVFDVAIESDAFQDVPDGASLPILSPPVFREVTANGS